MKKNLPTTLLIGAATVLACLVFTATLARATLHYQNEDELDTEPSPSQAASPNGGDSMRLVIPSIDVDAKVQDVGLGKSGNMAVPSNYSDVGWYRNGPVPGERGSAVMDGHVDNGFGMDAVFKKISELAAGDDIFVEHKDGTRTHFKVSEVATYDAKDVPRERIFTRDDAVRLNLITCSGEWDSDAESYDQRVVVYAVLAE